MRSENGSSPVSEKKLKVMRLIILSAIMIFSLAATRTVCSAQSASFEKRFETDENGNPVAAAEKATQTKAFYIIIIKGGDRAIAEEAAPVVSKILFDAPVIVLKDEFDMPEAAYVDERQQYFPGRIFDVMMDKIPPGSLGLIAITDKDIFTGRYEYVLGLSDPKRKVGIVSTFRMKSYGSDYRYLDRVEKGILHETGHILGFEHEDTSPEFCIMARSVDVSQVDNKLKGFCPYHREEIRSFLEKQGLPVPPYSYVQPMEDLFKTPQPEEKNAVDETKVKK